MESKSVKVAAVENADARLKEITTRMCISAIADYDAGLIQGFIDGANWARSRQDVFIDAEQCGIGERAKAHSEGYWLGKNNGEEIMKLKAITAFKVLLAELCPELLGYGAAAVEWENEFKNMLDK